MNIYTGKTHIHLTFPEWVLVTIGYWHVVLEQDAVYIIREPCKRGR